MLSDNFWGKKIPGQTCLKGAKMLHGACRLGSQADTSASDGALPGLQRARRSDSGQTRLPGNTVFIKQDQHKPDFKALKVVSVLLGLNTAWDCFLSILLGSIIVCDAVQRSQYVSRTSR